MEARGTCNRRQRSETRCDSGGSLTDWMIDVPFDGEDLLATPDSHRQSHPSESHGRLFASFVWRISIAIWTIHRCWWKKLQREIGGRSGQM
ncbi:hypothetical protein TIFTF001_022347 [Ficus carica]|uniref:Uncharacterized protein n=1 Tax=Ficus carica TaxID=3494 RepID=A0AA88DBM4_FICCA|nr:hypothetical protein TIFTF001_022347 [Ficus carica]